MRCKALPHKYAVASECGWNHIDAGAFLNAAEEVHVLDGLTSGALDHVVDDRSDNQQARVFVRVQLDVTIVGALDIADIHPDALGQQPDEFFVRVRLFIGGTHGGERCAGSQLCVWSSLNSI